MTSGMADLGEQPVWLQWNDETQHGRLREYYVYALSSDESRREWTAHRRFEELVGSHWCMTERCGTHYKDFQANSNFMSFYEEYPPAERPDYTDRPAIGTVRIHVARNDAAREHGEDPGTR